MKTLEVGDVVTTDSWDDMLLIIKKIDRDMEDVIFLVGRDQFVVRNPENCVHGMFDVFVINDRLRNPTVYKNVVIDSRVFQMNGWPIAESIKREYLKWQLTEIIEK